MTSGSEEPRPDRAVWSRRAAEMAAVFMIGDGTLGAIDPDRHVDLWKVRSLGGQYAVAPFVDRPRLRRAYGLLQIAAGVWLAARQRADGTGTRAG